MLISFEFFPPRTEEAEKTLIAAAKELAGISPEFFSVTFGANGSLQAGTQKTIALLSQETAVNCVPHISCVNSTRSALQALLTHYKSRHITQLVVLRGDKPSGSEQALGDFNHASELVAFIRETTGDHFKIYVAAYPEYHPESKTAARDLHYLKQKVKAGADALITQYFYNNDAYFHLLDNCQKHGIDVPVFPGIMPITNFKQLARFSDACGAELPRWLRQRLEDFGEDLISLRAFGHQVVLKLCEQLRDGGVPGFHFYTLNQSAPSIALYRDLKITPC
ncbi:MAG: metF [Gammaproteobacteria bacterium]|jgi:methylenetetrahydrofolate reductase (NADPH)|nr:metF [Gammaproteobacteria bacterium]